MERELNRNAGIKLLIKKYKKTFQIPENMKYYSKEDYKVAEKKFIKFALLEGKV